MRYSFKNDYAEGCHPRILEALQQTNLQQEAGYGLDRHTLHAAELIRKLTENPDAQVHLVSGGTQANLIVISALLKPHESVIAATSGHIFTNEAGAIEATGHKVHGLESPDGKITAAAIAQLLKSHNNVPHQVRPRLVYISNATEIGTVYTAEEIRILSNYCKSNRLLLFCDGARLGNALMSDDCALTLPELASYTDAFYIGGTKNGALIGEAIVLNNPEIQEDFVFQIKQKGAMLAKGRLLGIQFEELFRDGLYFDLAMSANRQAMKIKKAFREQGYGFYPETFTNQIFPVVKKSEAEKLAEKFDFYIWNELAGDSVVLRLITSWATPDSAVSHFTKMLSQLSGRSALK